VSQDDVEHVRRDVEHYERTGEPLWEDRAPDFEVHDHDMPDVVGIYRGHDGWREWVAHFAEAWENFTIKALEFIDAGDGMVVEVVRVSAQGRASGVTVESIDGLVWTVRDGKTLRLDWYSSRAEALEAVGLGGPASLDRD
jgi:ketosteroid isomerase-like protein